MSITLLTFVTLAYLGTAYDLGRDGHSALALVFAAYAVANVGFIWLAWKP
jgi:UDP-N-acetylmuramyl pentapeptide phosphotransferase/UDP-N-acetylglucosamine-1-phosphate transferase